MSLEKRLGRLEEMSGEVAEDEEAQISRETLRRVATDDLRLVVLEVRAAPFRSSVDRDGLPLGDALAPVVADPV